MCARFTLTDPSTTLAKFLETIDRPFIVPFFPAYKPSFNIAPTQYVPVIRHWDKIEVVSMRWGLVPSWAKSLEGPPLFNARAETITEKPSFQTAFKRRRCIIPASGFFEWGGNQPHYITLKNGEPMAFAGLWEAWASPDGPIESCTIITTSANEFMQPLHERMPVILGPDELAPWLDPDAQPEQLLPMLGQYAGEMAEWKVSSLVGDVRNNSSELIQPN